MLFIVIEEAVFLVLLVMNPSRYESVFATTSIQFGFKLNSSTSLCTAAIMNIISRCLHNGSPVLGCFIDARKVFHSVDHDIIFGVLKRQGLTLTIIDFLLFWYKTKYVCVGNQTSE